MSRRHKILLISIWLAIAIPSLCFWLSMGIERAVSTSTMITNQMRTDYVIFSVIGAVTLATVQTYIIDALFLWKVDRETGEVK